MTERGHGGSGDAVKASTIWRETSFTSEEEREREERERDGSEVSVNFAEFSSIFLPYVREEIFFFFFVEKKKYLNIWDKTAFYVVC